jgi:hypothetical protein
MTQQAECLVDLGIDEAAPLLRPATPEGVEGQAAERSMFIPAIRTDPLLLEF